MTFIVFLISLVVLLVSANFLVKQTEGLSSKVKISPLIIGATAIAFGTSLPELSVTITSITESVPDLSLGNVIGSNITNILLIAGIAILVFPMRIGTTKTQKNNIVNLVVTLLFISAFFLPTGSKEVISYILAGVYVLFFVAEIFWGEKGSKKEDKYALSKMKKDHDNPIVIIIKIAVAIILLLSVSHYTVDSAIQIAKFFKLQNEIIGLSLIAIGTSLPELIASFASGINKDYKLLMGDVQGSGIFNLAILGAVTLRYTPKLDIQTNIVPLFYLALSTIAIYFLTRKYEGTTIPRYYGLFFLLGYSSYLLIIFL